MLTDTTKRYTVVLSAALSSLTPDVNKERSNHLAEQIKGYEVERGLGCYKGVCETSFKVRVGLNASLDGLVNMALGHFEQESVLVIDHDLNTATLHYLDGHNEVIGRGLYLVSPVEVKNHDNYSVFDNAYSIVC